MIRVGLAQRLTYKSQECSNSLRGITNSVGHNIIPSWAVGHKCGLFLERARSGLQEELIVLNETVFDAVQNAIDHYFKPAGCLELSDDSYYFPGPMGRRRGVYVTTASQRGGERHRKACLPEIDKLKDFIMDDERKRLTESLIQKGKSYADIGETLGVSKQRAHQICQALGLRTRHRRLITGAELREALRDIKLDPLRDVRRIIYKLMKRDSSVVSTILEAKLPRDLAEEFKAMPGLTSENFRAAVGLYILAISGGRNPGRVFVGGIPRIRAITQEFVIERRSNQPLSSIGARVSEELFEDFKALPGIASHNIERAVRLYILAMKEKSEY